VDEQISRAQQQRNLGQQVTRDIALQTGQILTGVADQVEKTFRSARIDYQRFLGDVFPNVALPDIPSLSGREDDANPKTRGGVYQATGSLGSYSTPTTMTFGEAGSETVAILRNARTKTMNWGGGGGPSYFQFTLSMGQVTVRDDEDINRIARAVEQVMTQKAGLLGMMRDR